MFQKIPNDKYKRLVIGENDVIGYKSRAPHDMGNDCVSLTIESSHFKLHIKGREHLLKLREVIDFALEVKEE